MEQVQVPFILAMKDDSESISDKKKSHKLAEYLRCPLANESNIIRTLRKKSLPTPSTLTSPDFDEFDYDLSFELLFEIALTQLDLKLNVIVNMLFIDDARREKFEELETSGKARFIIIQEESGFHQDDYDGANVLKVSSENESFNVNEISTKIFHLLSADVAKSEVIKSEKPKKEPINDHLHELILSKEPRKQDIQCSSCLKLVSGLSYVCAECDQFTVHKSCAESSKFVQDFPNCFMEHRPLHYDFENIHTYTCNTCEEFSDHCYDCLLQTNFTNGFLPAIAHHEKHEHFLNFIVMPFKYDYRYICGICDQWGGSIGYKCYDCCYDVHVCCITRSAWLSQYFSSLERLLDASHIDNLRTLKALIYPKNDQLPLFHGATKRKVTLDVLRRKFVLLLITNLEYSSEEIDITKLIYDDSKPETQYEIVWLPVVDQLTLWNEAKQKQFEKLRASMTGYSISHPALLHLAVIKYIKEVWHFNKKPMLVALDPQGKVVNPNALHMVYIWGSIAFPFTSHKEEALWEKETWGIDFLAGIIDPNIIAWIQKGKYICLYGGEDMDWIRKFTTCAEAAAKMANIQLEMLYVGKSNPKENIRKNIEIIRSERLSHVLQDLTLIWFFWGRLESMFYSKVQYNRTVENDSIMQEIIRILSFDGSDQGWAVIAKGAGSEHDQMTKAEEGIDILKSFEDFQSWRQPAEEMGFVPALNAHLYLRRSLPHFCTRLILP